MPDIPYAFDEPDQKTAFNDVDQAGQNQSQIQGSFEQQRGMRNSLQALARGQKAMVPSAKANSDG